MASRNVTAEEFDPAERYSLFRLCDCPTCEGKGKVIPPWQPEPIRCVNPDCRGEGRIRQEVAACASPEAVGLALVTLAREGEFSECPVGLLDRLPACETCKEGFREGRWRDPDCPECKGSGIKPTGTWLIRPWLPSARNVTDAARTLAKSKSRSTQ